MNDPRGKEYNGQLLLTTEELKLEIGRHWELFKSQSETLANLMADNAGDDEVQDCLIELWQTFDETISPENL